MVPKVFDHWSLTVVANNIMAADKIAYIILAATTGNWQNRLHHPGRNDQELSDSLTTCWTQWPGTDRIANNILAATTGNWQNRLPHLGHNDQELTKSLTLFWLQWSGTDIITSSIRDIRWPKWLTFHFHTTSHFRILNSEFWSSNSKFWIPNSEICTTNFGIRNCEVYIMWASGNR